MNTKRAFTMVELIFVIVILGILAAVAVPRLNASRQDAEVAKFKANLRTVINDIETFYAAKGTTVTDESRSSGASNYADIRKITNVPAGKSTSNDDTKYFAMHLGGKPCLEILSMVYGSGQITYELKIHKSDWDANELCQETLKSEQVKPLFVGIPDGGWNQPLENAIDTQAGIKNIAYSVHWLNRPSGIFDNI